MPIPATTKTKAIFLSLVGAETSKLIGDLCTPDKFGDNFFFKEISQ